MFQRRSNLAREVSSFARVSLARVSLVEAVRPVIDSLECRRMMSAANVVDVTFRGVTAPAIKDSFNVGVKDGIDFVKLATKAGFAAVTPLGSGFFNFTTQWTPEKLSNWAKNQGSKIVALAPNYVASTTAVPNDTLYSDNQWHLNNTTQTIPNPSYVPTTTSTRQVGVAGADIDAQAAWNITTGSSSVIVAVLDTGLDVSHPDIAPNVYSNPNEIAGDGIDNDGNGYIDDTVGYDFFNEDNNVQDFGAHGTWVSGVIAGAGNNGQGIAGVSWSSKILPVKVFSDVAESTTTDDVIIKGINYVTDLKRRGANIAAMNLSLGGGATLLNNVMARAVQASEDAGIVFVTAAGNDSLNIDAMLQTPARNAFISGGLVVAATDNQDNLASFSNFGHATVAVAAPGVQIFTTHSKDTIETSDYTDVANNNAQYKSVDGTSFASPIVAGIVALAKSAYPQATPQQIVQAIKDGVDKIPSLSGINGSGESLVTTGGRVNAYNTLRILQNRLGTQNNVTQGNWIGAYGTATGTTSSFVYGGTTGTPTLSFLTSSLVPASASVDTYSKIKASKVASDVRLLRTPDGSTRTSSFLTSGDTISYSFDFGTTTTRLSLYAVDADKTKATQTINVVDIATGLVLQSVSMTKFEAGRYVSFDLTGAVRVDVVPANGRDAIVNGLFVDPTPTTQTVSTDTLTKGSWTAHYGDQGYILPAVGQSLPTSLSYSTTASVVTGKKTSDALAPESLTTSKVRSSGLFTAGSTFDLTLTRTDANARRVTLYTYNTSKTPRLQRIQQIDSTGAIIASADVVVSKSGQYTTFALSTATTDSTATFRITSLGGGSPSIAGVFVSDDPTSTNTTGNSASYVGSDSTTAGNWRKTHVADGAYVVGASSTMPSPFTGPISLTGSSATSILTVSTKNAAALLNPNSITGRIVGYISTTSTFDVALDTATQAITRLSAYFVDFDKKSRIQDVSIVDATTNEVLSTVRLHDFEKGRYVTFDITGSVFLRVTRVSGPSATLSGIFVD